AHTVRMVFCIIFYGFWGATVAIPFTKYWIYCTSFYFVIFRFYLFFLGSCSGFRIIWNIKTFLFKLSNCLSKLWHGSTDIWKFYDVGCRGFCQFAYLGQVVIYSLFLGKKFWKDGQYSRRQ